MTRLDPIIPADLESLLLEWLAHDDEPAPAQSLKEKVMRRVESDMRERKAISTVRSGEGAWSTVAEGVEVKTLRDDGVTHTWLARMARGARLPGHVHEGDEEVFVLEGSVTLNETVMRAGDYQIARPGSRHSLIASMDGCLVLMRTPAG